jgi:hypothetical protein
MPSAAFHAAAVSHHWPFTADQGSNRVLGKTVLEVKVVSADDMTTGTGAGELYSACARSEKSMINMSSNVRRALSCAHGYPWNQLSIAAENTGHTRPPRGLRH